MIDRRPRVTVIADGVTHLIEPGGCLRFGRERGNDVVVASARRGDTEDTLVSRRSGVLVNDFPQFVIRNEGTYVPFEVQRRDEPGVVRRVECGDELRLPTAPMTVSFDGRVRRYVLTVEPEWSSEASPSSGREARGDGPATEGPLDVTEERRLDLAALCAPLLASGARRSARAASYADAARRRGIGRKTLEKRVEHLVAMLRADGLVPGLEPGADVKQAVCEYAVRSGTVTVADVARLAVAVGGGPP